MCIEIYKETYNQTHRNMCFLSHRDGTTGGLLTPGAKRQRFTLTDVCTAGKAQARNRQK